jgi:Cys-tRNA(Pro)/Cys-tRNA(Cys) deacylase
MSDRLGESRPQILDEHVRRLDRWLRSTGVPFEFIMPGTPMPTVSLAAAAIGVAEREILKSLLFEGRNGDVALVIASGPSRVDKTVLAEVTGLCTPRLATPETVLALTGFPAGGVAPVGHTTRFPVYIDEALMQLDEAFGGGGSEDVLLRLRPEDIVQLTHGTVVALTPSSLLGGSSR